MIRSDCERMLDRIEWPSSPQCPWVAASKDSEPIREAPPASLLGSQLDDADQPGGLLDVGLAIAVRALDFVHRSISFESVADDWVPSVAVTVPCQRLRPAAGRSFRPHSR